MKRTLLLIASTSIAYITLSGYASGPSGTPAGVNTAKTGCGGASCHGASFTPVNMTLQVIEDGQSTPVADGKYKPNQEYKIAFTVNNPSSAKFGYILLVTDASNNQAGVLSNSLSSPLFKITTKGAYTVAEQPSAQSPIAGGAGAIVDWLAPSKGKGAITFHVAFNCTNGNTNADAGDTWALKSMTFQEGWALDIEGVQQQIAVAVYPNPATNVLNIDADNTSSNYSYTVFNLSGSITAHGNFSGKTSVDVSSLATGVHFVKVTDGNDQKTIIFNKL